MAEGDKVHIHEDGTRHLVRGESPIKRKILERHEDNKRAQASFEEVKIRRIAWKRGQQQKKGWPADKSPI